MSFAGGNNLPRFGGFEWDEKGNLGVDRWRLKNSFGDGAAHTPNVVVALGHLSKHGVSGVASRALGRIEGHAGRIGDREPRGKGVAL